jgi:transglutaminase-like putative cysteine protease
VFTVRADRPAYWRVIALDWFSDDNAWGVNKATEHSASTLTEPDDLPPSAALHQQFDIKEIDPHWLPAAYRPVQINLNDARVVPSSLTLLVDSTQPIGPVVYDVQSAIPTPSVAMLRNAPLDPKAMPDDIELPRNFPQSVKSLAQQVTAGAEGPFDRAVKLQEFFRKKGNFTYTVDTNLEDSTQSIVQFLFQQRRGFCEQFAASFAAMARAVDLPARVAVGYQPGTIGSDGLFHVTNRNAHAWPEVWINGAGWIPFEPTPAFREPTLGLGTGGPQRETPSTSTTSTTTNTSPSASLTLPTVRPTVPGGGVQVQQQTKKPSHRSALGTAVTVALIGLTAAAVVGLILLAIVAYVLWRRTYRRRHASDVRQRVLGAWAEALDVLASAGVPLRPSATALEFALRHAPAHGAGDAGPALMELARFQSAAMFAPDPPTADDASAAWEQVDVIRASAKRTVTRSARWRRRFRSR